MVYNYFNEEVEFLTQKLLKYKSDDKNQELMCLEMIEQLKDVTCLNV